MKALVIAATLAATATTASAGPFGSLERSVPGGDQGMQEVMRAENQRIQAQRVQSAQELWRQENRLNDIRQAQRETASHQPPPPSVYTYTYPVPVPVYPVYPVRPSPWQTCYGCWQ